MKYCMKCGVSVDENKVRFCPLCNSVILNDEELANLSIEKKEVKKVVKKENASFKESKESPKIIRRIIYYSLLISVFMGLFTLFIIDLASGFNITWSKIPLLSIVVFYFLFVYPIKKRKRFYYFITFDMIILSIYFLLLNYFISRNISWSYYVVLSLILFWIYLSLIITSKIKSFVLKLVITFIATALFVLMVTLGLDNSSAFSELALPINALVFFLIIISYLFIKTYIYNWFVIIATLSINISILCFGIDLLIQRFLDNPLSLKWSYIVLIVLIPFSLLMYYLNNRYKIHNYLIKKFHI